jgi:hypothetical protein
MQAEKARRAKRNTQGKAKGNARMQGNQAAHGRQDKGRQTGMHGEQAKKVAMQITKARHGREVEKNRFAGNATQGKARMQGQGQKQAGSKGRLER